MQSTSTEPMDNGVPPTAQPFGIDLSLTKALSRVLIYPIITFSLIAAFFYFFLEVKLPYALGVGVVFSIPVSYRLVQMHIQRRKNAHRIYVDKKGLYLSHSECGVKCLPWRSLSRIKTISLFGAGAGGIARVFPVMILLWPPSVTLKFDTNEQIEILNILNCSDRHAGGSLEFIFSDLLEMSEHNSSLAECILRSYPGLDTELSGRKEVDKET